MSTKMKFLLRNMTVLFLVFVMPVLVMLFMSNNEEVIDQDLARVIVVGCWLIALAVYVVSRVVLKVPASLENNAAEQE